MMKSKINESKIISALFSRPPSGEEVKPAAWEGIKQDILNITKDTNKVMCVYADVGAGKTTFIRHLDQTIAESVDVIILNPFEPMLKPGWISAGLAQWLSSKSNSTSHMQKMLMTLSETNRPVLICLDICDLPDLIQTSTEISSILNMADATGINLSVLLVCPTSLHNQLINVTQFTNRLVYSKPLPLLSHEELLQVITKRIHASRELKELISSEILINLIGGTCGSPGNTIKLICKHIGIELPMGSPREPNLQKPVIGKRTKSKPEETPIAFDELLAPQSK